MKLRACLTVLLVACVPGPAAAPPANPDAPVFALPEAVVRSPELTLRGEAAANVSLRLFADSACAGPVFLRATAEEFGEGLKVELVPWASNVFSASAVTSRGVASECSRPVTVRYMPTIPWSPPTLTSAPLSPSKQTRFVLSGVAPTGSEVRLHEYSCYAAATASLSADDYFLVGFPVDVEPNMRRIMAVEAVLDGNRSSCPDITLFNDTAPPTLEVRLGSPSPSPQRKALVVIGGNQGALTRLTASPDCSGDPLNDCGECAVQQVEFPPNVSTVFSVLAIDAAGNHVCVQGEQPWVHDPSLPNEEAVVLRQGHPVLAQVPAGRTTVQLFHSLDCSGPLIEELSAWDFVYAGFAGPFTGDALSARSVRSDGGLDPCSNAVLLLP